MTDQDLTEQEQHQLIEDAIAASRETANAVIASGVAKLQEQWIEARYIEEALASEIISLAQQSRSGNQTAAFLRTLATWVEGRDGFH